MDLVVCWVVDLVALLGRRTVVDLVASKVMLLAGWTVEMLDELSGISMADVMAELWVYL